MPPAMLPAIRAVCFLVGGVCGIFFRGVDLEELKRAASSGLLKPVGGLFTVALPCGLGLHSCQ